jgi:hypothetical protein
MTDCWLTQVSLQRIAAITLYTLLLSACGPSEKQIAEKKRIECLDKFCYGDAEPSRDYTKYELLKFNGEWYLGPKEYFSNGHNGALFYWPTKAPGFGSGDSFEDIKGKSFRSIAVEIFLRGRYRWPDPTVATPWKSGGWEQEIERTKQEGFRIERQQLHAGLERVRFFDAQGTQYRHAFYLATQEKRPLSNDIPGIACGTYSGPAPSYSPEICTGGMFWQEDIYADFRLPAQYAGDWPEIYQEITRVLTLLKKVQP